MIVIAHRGSSGAAPENTLAAFRQGVRDRAAMIEFDVRLSRDGVPVVIHDRRLNRTGGRKGRVRELTAAELTAVDVGRRRGRSFAGECIPLLSDVLTALPSTVGLNVELKTDGDRRRVGALAHTVARVLLSRGKGRKILVSSFDHRALRLFRRAAPRIPVGVLCMPVRDFGMVPSRLARRAGAEAFICSRSQARLWASREAHRGGIAYIVYGVNTVRHLRRMEKLQVDGVITDFPARMRRAHVPGVAAS